jgi:hypothetical protein
LILQGKFDDSFALENWLVLNILPTFTGWINARNTHMKGILNTILKILYIKARELRDSLEKLQKKKLHSKVEKLRCENFPYDR